MDRNLIKNLVVYSFTGKNPNPTKYQQTDVKGALSDAIHELANDYNSYRRNKLDLFEIMQEAYDEILPQYVEAFMGSFAEMKTVKNGQKATFRRKRGRQRAKSFITRVGLSGVYEAFRLDSDTFEIGGHALGGAAYIDFERYICGDEDIAESAAILIEGLEEAILGEVQRALIASVNAEDRPAKNVYVAAGFDADAMAELCNIAKTYGNGCTIFAPPEFVTAMGPDAIGRPIYAPLAETAGAYQGYATPVYSPRDIQDIANLGHITTFRGNPIVVMPQSYTDESNTTTQINPGFAYIFPSGQEKVVKIVLEGETQVDEWQHRDRSFEVEVYKKVGVGIITNHNWCVYENTDLSSDNTKYPSVTERV